MDKDALLYKILGCVAMMGGDFFNWSFQIIGVEFSELIKDLLNCHVSVNIVFENFK